jgi:hypothetical protein
MSFQPGTAWIPALPGALYRQFVPACGGVRLRVVVPNLDHAKRPSA